MLDAETTVDDDEQDLPEWLDLQDNPDELNRVILLFVDAVVEIAEALREGPLRGHHHHVGETNSHGEDQKKLDIVGHDIAVSKLSQSPDVAGMVSEEVHDMVVPEDAPPEAPYIVCFDPLDGSSNLEINGSVGSIFSILERRTKGHACTQADVFASASSQLAAGYVLYGPATLLVITTGKTVASFALDETTGCFILVDEELRIPAYAAEFSINMSNQRWFEPPVARYIDECLAGETGPRGKHFNMRWAGAMVADVHRLFMRGGLFLYPALTKSGGENGKLRFLYEANPMAMLVEVAGGGAIARDKSIRSIEPHNIHQRVPIALGSRDEIEYLTSLYEEA